MKVNLFNDKQVKTIFESVQRYFQESFVKAHEELKTLLDAEVKRQLESNSEVARIRIYRQEDLDMVLKMTELNKQVKDISENYEIGTIGYGHSTRMRSFVDDPEKALLEYNENTDEKCNEAAMSAAEKVLGIDCIGYREDCLNNDIKARIATMAVVDYDSVVSLLETQIKIKDYFVTL